MDHGTRPRAFRARCFHYGLQQSGRLAGNSHASMHVRMYVDFQKRDGYWDRAATRDNTSGPPPTGIRVRTALAPTHAYSCAASADGGSGGVGQAAGTRRHRPGSAGAAPSLARIALTCTAAVCLTTTRASAIAAAAENRRDQCSKKESRQRRVSLYSVRYVTLHPQSVSQSVGCTAARLWGGSICLTVIAHAT